MAIFRVAARSLNGCLSRQLHQTNISRCLSIWSNMGNGPNDQQTNNSAESAEEFGRRIFGNNPSSNSKVDALFQKLDDLGGGRSKSSSRTEMLNDLGEGFDTLTDGMDGKLEKAAKYFEYDSEEIDEDGYSFRYDMSFGRASTYNIKDLDLTKPAATKIANDDEFAVTTEEVLRKADFRNVRFLANFITPAGIIIKRSQTGISAKAQRKIAREIKTARAFGLMPFTTMGTKAFIFGKTMEDLDDDYVSRSYDTYMGVNMEDP
ncbi:uncharacterized protein LOC129301164 isoform X2 [Prosopis cineraria]|uniref:uncharacterized protein LOC129301164 isoform X2 n=2 Tax=Prosopis cineraria TaxID=364024 RepID=UPI0024101C77|nr:uncharacterized protein LOC129301164 isoform X2 [Prosopis cineraria]XP_054795711.1 uncharacterized protein LOC129301164 isoform X2 [Prosopis cineraria]